MATAPAPKVKTEDTGKMLEMGICLAFGIPYDGKYKYGMDVPNKLKPRLTKLTTLFPTPSHTAKRGARYDFTAPTGEHLSAKSTKKGGGKVAPQVIGQSQPQKFCDEIGIPYTDVATLKQYIQQNIATILPHMVSHTFDCPNIYYNQEADTIRYITLTTPIDWTQYQYTWTCPADTWANSSTLKVVVNGVATPLVEFQFHTKSRTNMAVRWCYDNFLTLFADKLTVVDL